MVQACSAASCVIDILCVRMNYDVHNAGKLSPSLFLEALAQEWGSPEYPAIISDYYPVGEIAWIILDHVTRNLPMGEQIQHLTDNN